MIDHIGVIVADLEKSKKFYSSALGAGGRDNSAPGLRPHYHPNYYGAFVFDPRRSQHRSGLPRAGVSIYALHLIFSPHELAGKHSRYH